MSNVTVTIHYKRFWDLLKTHKVEHCRLDWLDRHWISTGSGWTYWTLTGFTLDRLDPLDLAGYPLDLAGPSLDLVGPSLDLIFGAHCARWTFTGLYWTSWVVTGFNIWCTLLALDRHWISLDRHWMYYLVHTARAGLPLDFIGFNWTVTGLLEPLLQRDFASSKT